MFALILATVLFSVRGINANTGALERQWTCQTTDFCINLSKETVTAEAGLCVVIPCSFNTSSTFTAKHIVWYKCEPATTKCGVSDVIFNNTVPGIKVKSGFKGRVSLLEPDVTKKDCSIIINHLTESDSGYYQFRAEGTMTGGKKDGWMFTKKTAVSVKALTQKPSVMVPPLTEGQQSTLICTAPGLCSGSAPEITWRIGRGEKNSHITGNITAFTETVTAVTKRYNSTLSFTPSAEHHGTDVTCKVIFKNNITTEKTETLSVAYVKTLVITGKRAVQEGGDLNLTCSVDSFPPSVITWTKEGSNKILKRGTGTANLSITSMSAEHYGKYICTASHQISNLTAETEVILAFSPRIFNSSTCVLQSKKLTCVCISEGFPLPTIRWPLVKNHPKYCLTTSQSNNTVNVSITVTLEDQNYTTLECISSNDIENVKKNLTVNVHNVTKDVLKPEYPLETVLKTVKWLQVITGFLIGVILSATICCLVQKYCRKKDNRSGNVEQENLEMMTTQPISILNKMDVGPAMGNHETHSQDEANGGAQAAQAALQSASGADVEPRDVEYSDLDFSLMARRSPARAGRFQESTETEYAEIKRDKTEESQGNDSAEQDEMLEGIEVEEGMMGEEKDDCSPQKEEEEALYSNVKDLMG
ncbi:sialic acid-binding Ig-like lectin 10 [Cheilinus undulatus]|uniref:sialic acid-binding Ig-like lectin 10 n=1 Tax=Cheilinus undulatus TaxID=241271 RepID=UPI001BD5252E|nr:sialic acid-binding Ig-like lectin 10 [Cheilinus undulatus]